MLKYYSTNNDTFLLVFIELDDYYLSYINDNRENNNTIKHISTNIYADYKDTFIELFTEEVNSSNNIPKWIMDNTINEVIEYLSCYF